MMVCEERPADNKVAPPTGRGNRLTVNRNGKTGSGP